MGKLQLAEIFCDGVIFQHAKPIRVFGSAGGCVTVDFDTLVVQNGDEVERLTKTEADLLWLLVVERDKSVPCEEIIDVLKAGGFTGDSSSIYVHVSHLKKKLGRSGALLCSERNIGYRLMR